MGFCALFLARKCCIQLSDFCQSGCCNFPHHSRLPFWHPCNGVMGSMCNWIMPTLSGGMLLAISDILCCSCQQVSIYKNALMHMAQCTLHTNPILAAYSKQDIASPDVLVCMICCSWSQISIFLVMKPSVSVLNNHQSSKQLFLVQKFVDILVCAHLSYCWLKNVMTVSKGGHSGTMKVTPLLAEVYPVTNGRWRPSP